MAARIRFREPDTVRSLGGDISVNIVQVGGTVQSASDWSAHFAFLDGAAREATLALVKAKTDNLDVALSTRATEATLVTRATEATLAGVNTRLGEVQATPTVNTVLDRLKAVRTQVDVLLSTRASEASLTTRLADTSFTSRVGEVGAAPATNTLLGRVKDVQDKLGDAATENTVIKELLDAQLLLSSIESRVGAIDPAPAANTLQDRLKGLKTRLDLLATESTLASFPKLVKANATLLASAARTTSGAGSEADASNFYAAVYFLDVTAVNGTIPILNASIEAQDPASLKWMAIANFPEMIAVGSKVLRVVGAIGGKNRVSWTIGGTDASFTFGVGVVHER